MLVHMQNNLHVLLIAHEKHLFVTGLVEIAHAK